MEYERHPGRQRQTPESVGTGEGSADAGKRELAELRLAALRQKLVDLDESAGTLRAVCLRIRSKFQAALTKVARGGYYATSMQDSVEKVRAEFDVVLSELSSLSEDDLGSGI